MADGTRAARDRRRRRHRRRRVIAGATAGVVVAGVGSGVGVALTTNNGPSYRVATAGPGSVTQTVASVGTVSTVNTSTVSFPVSGTVAKVDVQVGDQVSGGQTLASLDASALQQSVNSANAQLAQAKQALAADQDAQNGTSTSSSGSSSSSPSNAASNAASNSAAGTESFADRPIGAPTPSGAPRSSASSATPAAGPSTSNLSQAVKDAQRQVSNAQQALDRELVAVGADLQGLTANGGGCAPVPAQAPTPISYSTTLDAAGTVSGKAGAGDTVTLSNGDTQVVGDNGSFSFSEPAGTYTVTIQPVAPAETVDASKCAGAISQIVTQLAASDGYLKTLSTDLAAAEEDLNVAVHELASAAGPGSGQQPGGGSTSSRSSGGSSGSGGSRSGTGQPRTGTSGRTGNGGQSGNGGQGRAGQTGNSGQGRAGQTGNSGQGSNTGQTGNSGRSGSSARPVTAEQLAADQAAIDAAQAQVGVAQQNLGEATLTSPISGTVASLGITAGQSVGAASSSATITVVGSGAKQVTTAVSLTDIDKVKIGDTVQVKVDGVSATLTGKVSSIGLLNSTTGSATTYPVKVLLDPTSTALYDGSGASLSIVVNTVRDALTVPSSAVHRTGARYTVTVLRKGKPSVVLVQVGAAGPDLTQVTSGISKGDQVVLADLGAPLPSNGSTQNRGGGGLFNGGGGGFQTRRFGR